MGATLTSSLSYTALSVFHSIKQGLCYEVVLQIHHLISLCGDFNSSVVCRVKSNSSHPPGKSPRCLSLQGSLCLSDFVSNLNSHYKERETGSNRRQIREMRLQVAGIWDACQPAETPELDTNHPSFMHIEKKACSLLFSVFIPCFFLLTLLLSS